jgi:hypothetical protein
LNQVHIQWQNIYRRTLFFKRLIELDSSCERNVENRYCKGRVVSTLITVRMGKNVKTPETCKNYHIFKYVTLMFVKIMGSRLFSW